MWAICKEAWPKIEDIKKRENNHITHLYKKESQTATTIKLYV